VQDYYSIYSHKTSFLQDNTKVIHAGCIERRTFEGIYQMVSDTQTLLDGRECSPSGRDIPPGASPWLSQIYYLNTKRFNTWQYTVDCTHTFLAFSWNLLAALLSKPLLHFISISLSACTAAHSESLSTSYLLSTLYNLSFYMALWISLCIFQTIILYPWVKLQNYKFIAKMTAKLLQTLAMFSRFNVSRTDFNSVTHRKF